MKKVFHLQQEKKKPERVIEATKHEVRKYIKRERAKKLPDGADYWELSCRFGQDDKEAEPMKSRELIPALDKALSDGWSQCYIEIIATAIQKSVAPTADEEVEES